MRVLVTGGSGFLGKRVVPLLVAKGHEVAALARTEAASSVVQAAGASPVAGNLDDPATIEKAIVETTPDALVKLSSLGFGHGPPVVTAAERAGMGRAIFISTTAIFTSLPAPSKRIRLEAEEAIRRSGLEWTILRPTMIYGGIDDRNMARLLKMLRRFPLVPVPGGGKRLQQPVHVEDLATAVVATLDEPLSSRKAYDLAGPDPLSLLEVLHQAAAAVGRSPRYLPLPMAPLRVLLRLYEKLAREPRLKTEQLDRVAEDKSFDISPARRDLGFDPRPFSAGIREEAALLT